MADNQFAQNTTSSVNGDKTGVFFNATIKFTIYGEEVLVQSGKLRSDAEEAFWREIGQLLHEDGLITDTTNFEIPADLGEVVRCSIFDYKNNTQSGLDSKLERIKEFRAKQQASK